MDPDKKENQATNAEGDKAEYFPKEITLKYDDKPLFNLANAINQQTIEQKLASGGSNSIGNRQIETQRAGNRIAKRSTWVNAILGGIALIALIISIQSVNQASRAADAAVWADSLTKVALVRDSVRYAETDYADSIKYVKRFQLDSLAAHGQINTMMGTLQETKKEFAAVNEPYLLLKDFKFLFNGTSQLGTQYYITNLQPFPAKVKKFRTLFVISPSNFVNSDSGFRMLKKSEL
jgi:hypothetical protein